MRILLVEDDELLGDGLAAGLRHCGYNVDWLQDGESARTALEPEKIERLIEQTRRACWRCLHEECGRAGSQQHSPKGEIEGHGGPGVWI